MIIRCIAWLKKIFAGGNPADNTATQSEQVEHSALQILLQEWGIRPYFITGLQDEHHAMELAGKLPLFYVWGEHSGPKGVDYTFTVNSAVVSGVLAQQLPMDDPAFQKIKGRLCRKLQRVAHMALREECAALNLMPSDILEHRNV